MTARPAPRLARVGDTFALAALILLALALARAVAQGQGRQWLAAKLANRPAGEASAPPAGFRVDSPAAGASAGAYLLDPVGGLGTTPGPFGCFGYDRGTHRHEGLDINVPVSTPVSAAAAGTVTHAGMGTTAAGLALTIDHGSGLATFYCHLSAVLVSRGQRVYRGQVVARTGGRPGSYGAGNSAGPHLHFSVYRNGVAIDPAPLIGRTCR